MHDFTAFFHDGATVVCRKKQRKLHLSEVGNLVLPSGAIIACDPLVFPETEPFVRRAAPGKYAVTLAIVRLNSDERVAFARIAFSKRAVRHWTLALIKGQKLSKLKDGHVFGYPVDSGNGCFMDAVAARELQHRMNENPDYFLQLIDEMKKTYRSTWSWLNMPMHSASKANLVAFSTGFGDGLYASYWGLDDQDNVVQLVTDFGLADPIT